MNDDFIPFKQQFTLDQRKQKFQMKNQQFPNMIPLVIEKHQKSSLSNLQKNMYLVAESFQVAQLRELLRKSLKLTEKQSLFIYVDLEIVQQGYQQNRIQFYQEIDMGTLYSLKKDLEDNFLYIRYSDLETFG